METSRPMTQEEHLRLRRTRRIDRDDLDRLTLCLPLDCMWGDPITPEVVQAIDAIAWRAYERAWPEAMGSTDTNRRLAGRALKPIDPANIGIPYYPQDDA